MLEWYVTYDIVTPESAEDGEADERGWINASGWHLEDRPEPMSLREALRRCGPGFENSGRWFTESSSDTDYRTGSEETRSLHPPPQITPSSYARVARLLGAK